MHGSLPKLFNIIAILPVFMIKKTRGKVLSSKLGLLTVKLTVRVASAPPFFEAHHSDMKCVLSKKESIFTSKLGPNFHICLRSWRRRVPHLTPPPKKKKKKNRSAHLLLKMRRNTCLPKYWPNIDNYRCGKYKGWWGAVEKFLYPPPQRVVCSWVCKYRCWPHGAAPIGSGRPN